MVLKNEHGWAMPLVLMVIVVITLLGTALWAYSMADLKQVTREEKRMQAYYLARSGAELVADLDKGEDEYRVSFKGHEIKVQVQEENGRKMIISRAEIDDITESLKLELIAGERYWVK